MREFPSYRSYWNFASSVSRHWRYVRSVEMSDFLESVLATSREKEELIPAGSVLFRAQVGHDWRPEDLEGRVTEEFPCAFPPERMKPLQDRAVEGRANAKGIPCLYLGTHEETAVAEVRPWVGALVSVARLRTTRPLRVVNCTSDDKRIMLYFNEPAPEERQRAVWRDIDRAFSQPVSPSDDVASYAPTQVLAEVFRQSGPDGVAYTSAVGPGHNIAIFDTAAAEVISCGLVEIRRITVEYNQADNPYFVTKHIRPSTEGAEQALAPDEGTPPEPTRPRR